MTPPEGLVDAPDGSQSRLDRELIELTNELRIILPGVQVLFAFLLTVPFTNRFASVNNVQRSAYFVALIGAALAAALLISPAAFHRIRFRQRDKKHMLVIANRAAVAGLALLALAMSASVLVVADVVVGTVGAWTMTAIVATALGGLWFGLPLHRRATR